MRGGAKRICFDRRRESRGNGCNQSIAAASGRAFGTTGIHNRTRRIDFPKQSVAESSFGGRRTRTACQRSANRKA